MRINKEIRAEKVRVITEDGEQLGVLGIRQALDKAVEMGKDLVEISPNAEPPVCKIIDYGKFKYQQTKKEKEIKKAQHQIRVKEIKVRPNIDMNDLKTKENQLRDFVSRGDKVRITCMFRGRELLHIGIGHKLIDQIVEDVSDVATLESPAKLLGKNLSVVLMPAVKSGKKVVKKEIISGEDKNENEKIG